MSNTYEPSDSITTTVNLNKISIEIENKLLNFIDQDIVHDMLMPIVEQIVIIENNYTQKDLTKIQEETEDAKIGFDEWSTKRMNKANELIVPIITQILKDAHYINVNTWR